LPECVNQTIASSTRASTKSEQGLAPDKQLRYVAYVGQNLIDTAVVRLLRSPKFEELIHEALDTADSELFAFVRGVDSFAASHGLQSGTHSEQDHADHIVARILVPLIKVLEKWRSYEAQDSAATDVPNFVSAKGSRKDSITDRLLRIQDVVKAVLEFKTSNSLTQASFIQLFAAFDNLRQLFNGVIRIPFHWMTAGDNQYSDKANKQLAQTNSTLKLRAQT
jgi:hypothetical protein